MDEFIKKKFTTSEFAKLHNVNKKTLIYYDNIGLFCPAEVYKNGYRYYTFAQNFTFVAIRLLRRMQVPLKEVKKYLSNYSTDNLLDLLYSQNQMLDEQISEMLWLKKIVQNKIENLENKCAIDFKHISAVEEKEQILLLSPALNKLSPENIMFSISNFMSECYHNRHYTGRSCGTIMDAGKLYKRQNREDALLYYYYLADDDRKGDANVFCKPEGRYLVGHYKGSWADANKFYGKIIKFADKKNLVFDKYIFEEKLIDDMMMTEDIGYTEFKISIMLK